MPNKTSDPRAATVRIVAAFVSKNPVQQAALPPLIEAIHRELAALAASAPAAPDLPTPAQIKQSIHRDFLVSFENGKKYVALKRHLTSLGLSPEAYREKWGLPIGYPMTALAYSRQRADIAKVTGLGRVARRAGG
jgi:predicted transcriptional regulator